MVFTPDKEEYARRAAISEAMCTLWAYLDGQARGYEVEDALRTLVEAVGETVRYPCQEFWKATQIEDEAHRGVICLEALHLIERQLRIAPEHGEALQPSQFVAFR